MPTTANTTLAAGSILLSTLITNCRVLPVTQTQTPLSVPPTARLSRPSPHNPPTARNGAESRDGLNRGGRSGSEGGGGRGADDFQDGRGVMSYAREPRTARRKGDKFDKFEEFDEPYNVNGTQIDDGSDPGAVMYIIVVLVFYSTGVMVMIVRYLRTEKKELEEEVTLENFFKSMPDKQAEKEHRVNTVAIRAFHTLTSISYDDDELDDRLGPDDDDDDDNDEDGGTKTKRERDGSPSRRSDASCQPLLVTDL